MALLLVQTIPTNGGLALTLNAAAAGGDTFVNDGSTEVMIRNGSAAAVTVTIPVVASSVPVVGGGNVPVTATVINIAAGSIAMIGKLNPQLYNTAGLASLTYSAVATVTVSPFKSANL